MAAADAGAETVLVVDDEESVRRTFRDWLEGANLGVRVLAAADAAAALREADRQTIDLAVLDWNLGRATTACSCSKIWRSSIPTSWRS